MTSRGISRLLDIWETRAAKQQLEQYEGLSRDFQELDQAILLLPETQDNVSVASYRPFLDIINSDLSPNWTETSKILSDIFGELGQATKQEVPRGYGGIMSLRKAVGRTRIEDEKVGEIRHWLFLVTRSVHHTREVIALNPVTSDSILPDNGAASSHRGRNSPPRSQSLSVNPNLETTEQPSAQLGGRATSKRLREKGVSPENSSEEKPETRKRHKGKGRAEESSETDANGKGKGREGQGQIPKRVTRSSSGRDSGRQREKEKEETPRPISPTPAADRRNGRDNPAPLPPQLSPEEYLVRSVFPSIPADINLSPPASFDPAQLDVSLPFKRHDMHGGHQQMVNRGTAGSLYHPERNHLSIRSQLNLCSFTTHRTRCLQPFEPGQPLVLPVRFPGQVMEAINAIPELGKLRPTVNIFIAVDDGWIYRGLYEVAYDGSDEPGKGQSLPVPTGHGQRAAIGPHLDMMLRAHLKQEKETRKLLKSWDFGAKDEAGAIAENGTRNRGTRRRHIKFLALRCIGWDERSWEIWIARRNARLGIAN